MAERLAKLLAAFESKAAKLNKSSDSINDIIKAVEERLVRANAGVEVFLERPVLETGEPYDNDDERSTIYNVYQLGFTDFDSGWHLAVKEFEHHDYGEDMGSDRVVLSIRPLLARGFPGSADSRPQAISTWARRVRGRRWQARWN